MRARGSHHSTNAHSDGCIDDCAVNDANADYGHVVTPANVVASGLHSAHT